MTGWSTAQFAKPSSKVIAFWTFGISARNQDGLRRFKKKWGATESDIFYNYVSGNPDEKVALPVLSIHGRSHQTQPNDRLPGYSALHFTSTVSITRPQNQPSMISTGNYLVLIWNSNSY